MKDQYDNPVPSDLEILPSYRLCSDEELKAIFSVDWYEADGVILADLSSAETSGDSASGIFAVGEDGNLLGVQVYKIDDCLKRGNTEDGFYHA